MLFSSNVFLFLFLPVFLLIYYLTPDKLKNATLLVASLLFYTWGEQILVLVMVTSTLVDYSSARIIENGFRRTGLWLSIGANLSILFFFKYLNFFVDNIHSIAGMFGDSLGHGLHFTDVALPLGISFYTFQSMSYTVEVYRGSVKPTRRFIDFACFVTMFPQLVAGPIVRYAEISKDLIRKKFSAESFAEGIWRFTLGLGKKVILANHIGAVADQIYKLPLAEMDTSLAWLAAISYTFQIYFDFSGYSDMAIGLGKMLGFNFPENFNRPYRAVSITDFWRRWHMTLSLWFRDFLYIPLGGNRKRRRRTFVNLILVFLVTGLWHGAAWTFIVWGLYHGFFLILERTVKEKIDAAVPVFLRVAMTFTVVVF